MALPPDDWDVAYESAVCEVNLPPDVGLVSLYVWSFASNVEEVNDVSFWVVYVWFTRDVRDVVDDRDAVSVAEGRGAVYVDDDQETVAPSGESIIAPMTITTVYKEDNME